MLAHVLFPSSSNFTYCCYSRSYDSKASRQPEQAVSMGAGRGHVTAFRHLARHSAALCAAALLVFLLVAGLQYAHGHGRFGCETGKQLPGGAAPLAGGVRLVAGPVQPTARGRTLVIYVHGPTDPDYEENFRFFLREAVRVSNLCAGSAGAVRKLVQAWLRMGAQWVSTRLLHEPHRSPRSVALPPLSTACLPSNAGE